MSRDTDHVDWPAEAGDPNELPRTLQAPAELETRVVGELTKRGLIQPERTAVERHIGWRTMRVALATTACVALLALGVLIGRATIDTPLTPTSVLTGGETDLYAMLLYETDGYDRPDAAESITRYGEYSVWVAEALRRGQFVTGEDLNVDSGWLLVPSAGEPATEPATSVAAGAPLSGIFFIRASTPDHALALARELPHLKHGGQVLVQKTIPTDVPPQAAN